MKELDSPQQTVADVFDISQSLVSKWGAKERQLEEALKKGGAARKRISWVVKPRPGKYPLLEKQLYTDIRTKRAKGLRVTTKWIRIQIKKLISKEHGDDAAKDWKSTLSWRYKFCRRWGISLRRKSNSRKPLSDRLPKIKRWHARLVKRLARGKQLCPIFGRWPLSHRYDVDQVPCFFGKKDPVTLHCQEDGPRVTFAPNSGTDVRRDCSLQLCCRFIPKGGVQPKAGFVFTGTGQRIPKVETDQYDNRGVVFWQRKAWVNEEIACEWVLWGFKPFLQSINQREEVCLFSDNLSAQTTARFNRLLRRKCNTKQHLEPAESTDEIAVIDAGVGRMCKNHMHRAYDEWFEEEDNNDRIVNEQVLVSEKSILLTKWFGNAWDHVRARMDFDRFALKTGSGLAEDLSNQKDIKLQGLEEEYTFSLDDGGDVPSESDSEEEDEEEEDEEDDDDANEEEGGDDENEVDDVDSVGALDGSEMLGPVNVNQQGHFVKPAWPAILPQPPEDMAMHNLKKLKLCIALDYGREVGWEIGCFSNFYHTGTHKGEYVLNFEGVLWLQALAPLAVYGPKGKWVLLQGTPP